MSSHQTFTAADAERATRVLQRDPAAQAYGDFLRRSGVIGPAPLPQIAPAIELAEAEREVRRAQAQRFRL